MLASLLAVRCWFAGASQRTLVEGDAACVHAESKKPNEADTLSTFSWYGCLPNLLSLCCFVWGSLQRTAPPATAVLEFELGLSRT